MRNTGAEMEKRKARATTMLKICCNKNDIFIVHSDSVILLDSKAAVICVSALSPLRFTVTRVKAPSALLSRCHDREVAQDLHSNKLKL